jgi:hypothetical protein
MSRCIVTLLGVAIGAAVPYDDVRATPTAVLYLDSEELGEELAMAILRNLLSVLGRDFYVTPYDIRAEHRNLLPFLTEQGIFTMCTEECSRTLTLRLASGRTSGRCTNDFLGCAMIPHKRGSSSDLLPWWTLCQGPMSGRMRQRICLRRICTSNPLTRGCTAATKTH